MGTADEPDDPPTEGVRIIGAQEAAEAAGRPDVVSRRGRSDKKFGDRPDEPVASADMPKIRISTSESSSSPGGSPGAIPFVGGELDERTTTDDDDVIVVGGYDRPSAGHARIIDRDDESDAAGGDELFDHDQAETELIIEVTESPAVSDDDRDWAESSPFDEPSGADFDDGWDIEEPMIDGDPESDRGSADEESFVLPHWTEPATGQVPKVITGLESDEDRHFTDSPRWHSEGERGSMTDFTDLADDGPRLGALGGSLDDFDDDRDDLIDDDFDDADGRFTGRGGDFFDDDEFFDDEGEFADFGPPRQRMRRATRDDGQPPSSGGDRDLGAAVGVGVGLVAVGLVCFSLGGLATTLLVAVIILLAAIEATTALNRKGFATPAILALPAVLGLLLGTYFVGLDAYPVVLGLTVVTTLLWYLWVSPGPRAALKIGGTLLVVMWVGFLGSFATLMLGLGRQLQGIDTSMKSNPAIGVLIAAVIVTVSHDVGAYFTGRFIGKTPLSAASPNKTYEGLAGGIVAGIILPVIIVGVFGIAPIGDSIPQTIVFSALCAAAAPLGDLCQSAIKRDLKIKDMGALLPGHGGVLDRFDAMLFVLPTAYFMTLLLDVWSVTAR